MSAWDRLGQSPTSGAWSKLGVAAAPTPVPQPSFASRFFDELPNVVLDLSSLATGLGDEQAAAGRIVGDVQQLDKTLAQSAPGRMAQALETGASRTAEKALISLSDAFGSGRMADTLYQQRDERSQLLAEAEKGGNLEKWLGSTGSKIAKTVAESIAEMGLVAPMGTTAVVSASMGGVWNDSLREAEQNNITGWDAVRYAGEKTAIEGGLTFSMGRIGKRLGFDDFESILTPGVRAAAARLAKPALSKLQRAGKVAGSAGLESFEEGLIDATHQGVELSAGTSKAFDYERALIAAGAGGVAGGALSGVRQVSDQLRKIPAAKLQETFAGVKAAEQAVSVAPVVNAARKFVMEGKSLPANATPEQFAADTGIAAEHEQSFRSAVQLFQSKPELAKASATVRELMVAAGQAAWRPGPTGRGARGAKDFFTFATPEMVDTARKPLNAKEFATLTGIKKTSVVFRDAFRETVDLYARAPHPVQSSTQTPQPAAPTAAQDATQVASTAPEPSSPPGPQTGSQESAPPIEGEFLRDEAGGALRLSPRIQSELKGLGELPHLSDFRIAVRDMTARQQRAVQQIEATAADIQETVPDDVRQEAITNWIEAGGDLAVLGSRAQASADPRRAAGYEAAQNLTPGEIQLAKQVQDTYARLLDRAREYNIDLAERPNYVNHEWDFGDGLRGLVTGRSFSTSFRNARQRTYDTFFDGEQAGLSPTTKAIGALLPKYMKSVSDVITAKEMVRRLGDGKAEDGRPLVAPAGMVKVVDGNQGNHVALVMPSIKPENARDYVRLDHTALQDWKIRTLNEFGDQVVVQGDLLVHPDAAPHLKNVLGQSALREWWNRDAKSALGNLGKASVKFLLDDVQATGKQTMLGFLSPFHQVQEGTHAVGHQINPFQNVKVDLNNKAHFDAALHGLMLKPDRISQGQFTEGLAGGNKNLMTWALRAAAKHLPGTPAGKLGEAAGRLADASDWYQNYLFHEYIPGMKLRTYEHIVERNTKRFQPELEAGTATLDDVKFLSADQANAAYGHLNYADLGRNPTLQHVFQLTALAPDFLEARGRFVGQAAKGVLGRGGREQLAAIGLLAGLQIAASKILSKIIGGEWHFEEPFAVVAGNRKVEMRSVPADIVHLLHDARKFTSGRLSPYSRLSLDLLTGRNYRGERTTASEAITNMVGSTYVPITLQPLTRGLTQSGRVHPVSPWEQALGSAGFHVSRFSPTSKVYDLAADWVDEHGKEFGVHDTSGAVFPQSRYTRLRYALEDSNESEAIAEIQRIAAEDRIGADELAKRVKGSLIRPFTGTLRTDKAFRDSLGEGDQAMYDDGKERQKLLYRRFLSAIRKRNQSPQRNE